MTTVSYPENPRFAEPQPDPYKRGYLHALEQVRDEMARRRRERPWDASVGKVCDMLRAEMLGRSEAP